MKNKLSDKYEIKQYTFGDNLAITDTFSFTDKSTDISNALNQINNIYANRNVGAVILASDGKYNKGTNPLYIEDLDYSLYTIGLGDTNTYPDAKITEILHNKLAFLGNDFPIRVNISANNLKGKNLTLTVKIKETKVFFKSIIVDNNNFYNTETIILKAKSKGLQHYNISISTTENELNKENNIAHAIIDVIDSKQNILILANSPHPDISAIKKSLDKNINYNLEVYDINSFKKNIADYNLVIFHQLPSKSNSLSSILKTVVKNKIPSLFILGNQSDIQQLNTLDIGFNFKKNSKSMDDASPSINKDFAIFDLSFIDNDFYKYIPPLKVNFGNYNNIDNSRVLMYQKIGSVSTSKPLIFFSTINDNKYCFVNGDGLWRWRMSSFLQYSDFEQFDELINKISQFLALKVKKSRFNIDIKNIYYENEAITINAEVYNESFELTNTKDVKLEVINDNNKKYDYIFNKTEKAYDLNLGILPVGDYTYKTTTKIDSKSFSKEGKFIVFPIDLETKDLQADFKLLYQLSEKNNGNFFTAKDINLLADKISTNDNIIPVMHEQKTMSELINYKWIFFLIIILISLEWFARKYLGAY